MCQLFTGRKQHTPSTLALSLCTQHSKAVLALELVSIKQQNLCVIDSLCSTHVTGDSSILCAPTTSLFPCMAFPLSSVRTVSCVCWACLVQEVGKVMFSSIQSDFLPPICIKQKGATPTSSQCHQTCLALQNSGKLNCLSLLPFCSCVPT